MNCDKVCSKLSAYIDNELSVNEETLIIQHLNTCRKCKQELDLLLQEQAQLAQLKPIKISSDFNAKLWQRIRNEDSHRSASIMDILLGKLVPIPAIFAVLLVLFSWFSTFSPLIYANSSVKAAVFDIARNSFTGFSGNSVINPLNYIEFCNKCSDMLCACCQHKVNCQCSLKRSM
jgi:negative regulator of sigma E activity